MSLKSWALEVRAPFLLLPLLLSALGALMAANDGHFSLMPFLSFTAVLLLLHVTVNTLNEYHDHLSGIDFRTLRTPYSGGSGMLQTGAVRPGEVRALAYGCFVLALVLSVHLVLSTTLLLAPIIAMGMVFSLFYTQVFARGFMGEVSAGLGLGVLPVMGAYLVQTGGLSPAIAFIALASGLLTFNLQLLNEFPDQEADRHGGRRNLVMALGEGRASRLYTAINAAVYTVIALAVLASLMPPEALLAMATLPLAYRASSIAMRRASAQEFIAGQKANVQVVMLTQLLLGLGIAAALLGNAV